MPVIFGLAGSLRAASMNAGLLRAAAEVAPEGTEVVIGTIRGVPLYDADVEDDSGVPVEVQGLKDQLAAADGLLLVTPEYNNGIPGVFKNAIDWMTRPARDVRGVFGGKPVAVLGASPGAYGTTLAQTHWLPVLRTLRMRPWWEGRMMVSRAGSLFDAQGNLTDDATRESLAKFMAGFAEFVARESR